VPAVEETDAARLLVEHLAALRVLLVLDNLEHLLGAAGQLAELVARCPQLAVLVTSRAPLRVLGEVEYPLQPLAVPAPTSSDVVEVTACPAVRVFAERARSVSPSFDVTDDNAPAVAALCRRLAGIPLALELAAARVRYLTPQALLARLDDAMARAGGPDLPARQRTMRATFDWSYDLLDEPEQRLLRLLSVFAGGCPLEAIEDIGVRLGHAQPVLPLLEVLVEHSLVIAGTDDEGRPRFGLLEPVAQYARMRQPADDWRRLRDAHAASYLEYAEQAAEHLLTGDQVVWLDRSERVDADLVAAMTWAVTSGDGETAGRLPGPCGRTGGCAAGRSSDGG
jgi:predicted ATPase